MTYQWGHLFLSGRHNWEGKANRKLQQSVRYGQVHKKRSELQQQGISVRTESKLKNFLLSE